MSAQLDRKPLAEQVYDLLLKKITSGAWPLHSKIPSEKSLMEEFGISRNTLREAIRALVHVGILEVRQGAGTIVLANDEWSASLQRRIAKSSLGEIFEVRHALETEIAVLACKRRTNEDLKTCLILSKQCISAVQNQDVAKFVKSDTALHEAIAKASHNSLLVDLYGRLLEEIEVSIYSTTVLEKDSTYGHTSLLQAIEARDAERAKQEVDIYITAYKQKLKIEE
ncbi:FadR/GntR family transcriptional regulator [Listeria aquatica]|uniref:FadR/GntR family transcriptional regulator n=1 Tax=Listeria aquatica TaxID=1494960 RepID=UPI0031F5468F